MPAQDNKVKPSTAPVHLGATFGVTPNPNATRPATIAAIGNPYGGMQGPSVAPHGVVGSTGIGNGLKSGSKRRNRRQGCFRRHSGGYRNRTGGVLRQGGFGGYSGDDDSGCGCTESGCRACVNQSRGNSKPPVQYTAEARELKVQGDVVLRVTFTSSGQVVVQSVLHGLGHGLDEEARRVAQQIRFRPATRDGRPWI